MKIVTTLTDRSHPEFLSFLKPSCQYFNLDLEILFHSGNYQSHRLKDVLLYRYLKELKEDEIVLFSDGHDAMMMADERELIEKFYDFKSNLIFSSEINCWPDRNLQNFYPKNDSKFKYLNCGAFMGFAGHILDLYDKNPLITEGVEDRLLWSNQFYWYNVYLKNQDTIVIDHKCEIFYNTASPWEVLKELDLKNREGNAFNRLLLKEVARIDQEIIFLESRIINKETGSKPCHLHFPGPLQKILAKKGVFDLLKRWESD